MSLINYNIRKKKYQIFTEEGKLVNLSNSLIIRNISQLRYTNKKKFSKGRTEHLFLKGEVELNPDLSKLKFVEGSRIIYFPSKHDSFQVVIEGEGVFDISEFDGYDVYCGLRKYKSHVTLIKGEDVEFKNKTRL